PEIYVEAHFGRRGSPPQKKVREPCGKSSSSFRLARQRPCGRSVGLDDGRDGVRNVVDGKKLVDEHALLISPCSLRRLANFVIGRRPPDVHIRRPIIGRTWFAGWYRAGTRTRGYFFATRTRQCARLSWRAPAPSLAV